MAPGSGAPAPGLRRAPTDASCSTRPRCSSSDLGFSGVVGVGTTDVSAPPPSELFSETNANSVAILLAGDAEAREEEKQSQVRFHAVLTEDGARRIEPVRA